MKLPCYIEPYQLEFPWLPRYVGAAKEIIEKQEAKEKTLETPEVTNENLPSVGDYIELLEPYGNREIGDVFKVTEVRGSYMHYVPFNKVAKKHKSDEGFSHIDIVPRRFRTVTPQIGSFIELLKTESYEYKVGGKFKIIEVTNNTIRYQFEDKVLDIDIDQFFDYFKILQNIPESQTRGLIPGTKIKAFWRVDSQVKSENEYIIKEHIAEQPPSYKSLDLRHPENQSGYITEDNVWIFHHDITEVLSPFAFYDGDIIKSPVFKGEEYMVQKIAEHNLVKFVDANGKWVMIHPDNCELVLPEFEVNDKVIVRIYKDMDSKYWNKIGKITSYAADNKIVQLKLDDFDSELLFNRDRLMKV